MQKMGRAVVTAGGTAELAIDAELGRGPHGHRARHDPALVHDQAVDWFPSIVDLESRVADGDESTVAHLTALLRVEWRDPGDDLSRLALTELIDACAVGK